MMTSAADKNSAIMDALHERGHTIINAGMIETGANPELSYIHTGLLSAIRLNTKQVDFVVGGCGTGQAILIQQCNIRVFSADTSQTPSMHGYSPKLTGATASLVLIELENGGLAHLSASFAADDYSADPWTFLVKVIGSEGTTRYTYQDGVEIKKGYPHSHTYTAYQGGISNEVAHFVTVCLEGGSHLSTLDDAIVAQKVVEACERSIAEGETVTIE